MFRCPAPAPVARYVHMICEPELENKMSLPERIVEDCLAAVPDGQKAMREVVKRWVSDPAALLKGFGSESQIGLRTLHRSGELTVLDFVWAPDMTLPPHTHEMAAVIGVYAGREDNIFWRRRDGTIEAAGAQTLGPRDVATLGKDIIHSVTNPLGMRSRAIHVYLGDFFEPPKPRREWDHQSLEEHDWTPDIVRKRFADAEAREAAMRQGTK